MPTLPKARNCTRCGKACSLKDNSKYCSDTCRIEARIALGRKIDLDAALVENSTARPDKLKRILIARGILEEKCVWCGLTEWRGLPAPLELDHVNGIRSDQRLENLRLLCANCHTQTETYCGRNKKK